MLITCGVVAILLLSLSLSISLPVCTETHEKTMITCEWKID